MDDGAPGLEVGFTIDTGGSFEELRLLQTLMNSTEMKVVRDAQQIEQATKRMIQLVGPTARITSFGNAATKELQNLRRETAATEKAGEALIRQLDRETAALGKTKAEMRDLKIEATALAAAQLGNTDLADRLFASARGRSLKAEAVAEDRAAAAAREADAASAERLRLATDPLYAATKRLNDELAESTRLYHAGVTTQVEYARQQDVLTGRIREVTREHDAVNRAQGALGGTAKLTGHHMQNLAFQFQDLGIQMFAAAGSSAPLKLAFTALLQQGAQIQGIMGQAGVGIREVGVAFASMSKTILLATVTNPVLLGISAAIVTVAGAIKLLQNAANDGADMTAYAKSLGLTAKEIRNLDAVTVTYGDTAKAVFQVAGRAIWGEVGPAVTGVWSTMQEWTAWIGTSTKEVANLLIGSHVGAFNAIRKNWSALPAVLGDVFFSAVNATVGAINALVRKTVEGINLLAAQANKILPAALQIPMLTAGQIEPVNNQFAGAGAKFGKTLHDEISRAVKTDYIGDIASSVSRAVSEQARKNAEERIRAQALEKGYLDPALKKAKALREEFEKLREPLKFLHDGTLPIKVPLNIDLPETVDIFGQWMDQLDEYVDRVREAAGLLADAWGPVGGAIGQATVAVARYGAEQEKARHQHDAARAAALSDAAKQTANADYARRNAELQIGLYGDLAGAAKGFFDRGTAGYKALHEAEKVFRAVQFAMSVRAMAQDLAETGASIANSAARTAAGAVEAVVSAIKSLPFPLNLAAGAATIAALASIGVSIGGAFGGGKNRLPKANDGTGTVLGDTSAKSDSLQRSIDLLGDLDTATLGVSRQMLTSLKSIDSKIGGFASLIARAGNVDASAGVNTGFRTDTTGKLLSHIIDPTGLLSKIPVIGGVFSAINGVIKSLFGTKTTIVGSGLYGSDQALGGILSGGFDAQYYSDVKKTKKFLGISTGSKYSTQYGAADPALANQFTLILRSFADAVTAAAGPLGLATDEITNRLNGFVVGIGKIDLKDLTGEQIQEKLEAVFGAAADNIAAAAIPGLERFQQVGEGYFETLVRVASTAEAVTTSLDLLGRSTAGLGLDAKVGLAGLFDSVADFQSGTESYFSTFYTAEEQTAARTAQLGKVFTGLGLALPATIAGYRALVDAQDLATEAGRAAYANLIQLAPAFADIATSAQDASSAAAIVREQQDLRRQLYEAMGDTAAIRALDLARLDPSNRALQQQIWAIQDAQEAAKAADQLREAWASVGEGIRDEIDRIRGLNAVGTGGSFASLLGQFNAANSAARAGDMDAAKNLPQLSKSLLDAAALAATSRQELDRVQAQTAASLEATYGVIGALTGARASGGADALSDAASAVAATATPEAANGNDLLGELRALREEVAALRSENNAGHAATSGNTAGIKRKLDDVTTASGGDAISVQAA